MRYIPSSRYTLDEIAAQCKAAINRPKINVKPIVVSYDEILHFVRREDGVLVQH